MATIRTVSLIDDLDGQPADGTLRFALDGTDYEIDVHNANADEIRRAFTRWIEAGRKVPGQRRAHANGGSTTRKRSTTTVPLPRVPAVEQGQVAIPTGRELTAEQRAMCRAWARTQGISVAERGRIAQETVDKWWGATDGGRHG